MEGAIAATSGALNPEGCLFCRRHDGGFVSREHVYSEALGNAEYVLPPGVVCDRCNNGPLSRCDAELIGFEPVALLRAERGLPTKGKQAVAATFSNAQVWFSAPGELNVVTNSPKVTRRMSTDGVRSQGNMDLIGKRVTAKRARLMTRSVWKSALELVYWDLGPEEAFAETYDGLREAVLHDRPEGWAVLLKNSHATPRVQLQYERKVIGDREAMPVRMSIFGVIIYTDALRRDMPEEKIAPPWEFSLWKF